MKMNSRTYFLVLIVSIVLASVVYSVSNNNRTPRVTPPTDRLESQGIEPSSHVDVTPLPKLPTTNVRIGTTKIIAERPVTEDEYEIGLGGRTKLEQGDGMLFSLGAPDYYAFWMKGMLFPIDIIWIDENKKVVDISANIGPDTYPQTFSPKERAMYVLEVPAGYASTSNITVGDIANF